MKNLHYKESWDGTYRDVSFEIAHWRLGWNYYLYIPTAQLPDAILPLFNLSTKRSDFNDRVRYYFAPSDSPIIDALDWHGGPTLYEKQYDETRKLRGFRIGCDYMHLYDENTTYHRKSVKRDAERTIDALWRQVPDLKVRCSWDGNYYPLEETTLNKNGNRTALKNLNK